MSTHVTERISRLAAPTAVYLCVVLYFTAGISNRSFYLIIAHFTLTCLAFALAVHGITWGLSHHSSRTVTQAALALLLSAIYLVIGIYVFLLQ